MVCRFVVLWSVECGSLGAIRHGHYDSRSCPTLISRRVELDEGPRLARRSLPALRKHHVERFGGGGANVIQSWPMSRLLWKMMEEDERDRAGGHALALAHWRLGRDKRRH
jgi:hypothetical protein